MPLIELFDPTSPPRVKEMALARRLGSLAGKKVGFLSNGKANASLLLAHIEKLLGARLGGLTIVWRDKGAAEPAPQNVLESLRGLRRRRHRDRRLRVVHVVESPRHVEPGACGGSHGARV